MFNIIKQGERSSAYVTEYVADTPADLADLPTNNAPGSTCIVISTSEVYMLNNNKEWKRL